MALRFVLTDHALSRFVERHPELNELDAGGQRQVLLAELEHGVPYGGQTGQDALYLLPCGDVAAVAWAHGRGFVKTVLTREHALANMQSRGAVLQPCLELHHALRAPDAATTAELAEVEADLRELAEQHFNAGISRKRRNALLRERGYDPGGKAGEIYGAAYGALVKAPVHAPSSWLTARSASRIELR